MNIITGTSGDDQLVGTSGPDTIQGLAGNDTLIGGNGDDILSGGPGIDVLTGGAGNDLFQDTLANLDGDTITDFSVGDVINFTDASVYDGFSIVGNTVQIYETGNSSSRHVATINFSTPLSGSLTFTPMLPGYGMKLILVPPPAPVPDVLGDYNADGRSDLLLRSTATGQFTDWIGQAGGTFSETPSRLPLSSDWRIVAAADFNGDGTDDVLALNNQGTLTTFNSSAGTQYWSNMTYNIGTEWHVAGAADFNGDGRDDLLLRNDAGSIITWLGQANGSLANNSAVANYAPPTGWLPAAVGDFNGDGRSDVLLRNAALGTVTEWLGQTDGGFSWNAAATFPLDGQWTVEGSADFNGDGRDDLLLRGSDGTVTEWLGQANGGFAWNPLATFPLDPAWHVAQLGDFNGDGKDDALLRNDNGLLTEWTGRADGGFDWNAQAVYVLNPDWVVQPPLHSVF